MVQQGQGRLVAWHLMGCDDTGRERQRGRARANRCIESSYDKELFNTERQLEVTKSKSGRRRLGRQQHADTKSKSRRWEREVGRLQTVQRE